MNVYLIALLMIAGGLAIELGLPRIATLGKALTWVGVFIIGLALTHVR